ncbi:MAG TPA: alpha/beta hydrolase [Steroidobacteraceae bacterium]
MPQRPSRPTGMRFRWHPVAFLLALATATCLSGCGKKTDSVAPSAATTGTPAAATAPAPAPAQGTPQIVDSGDGVHIEYRVYGAGEPAIVLVHGWSCDANYWNEQLAPLKAKYTVVAVDLAGHGASGKNRSDWSMASYGDDVAAVVRQIPNHQVIIVGHSMGGTVALEATRRIGDRVIGIIAVEALKSVGQPALSAKQIDMRLTPFRKDFIGTTRKLVTESLFPKQADPQFVNKVAYDMSLEPPEVGVPSMQALLAADLAPIVADIHVPVLAINSDLTPTDEARIRKSLPGFKAEVIPNSSHFLMMDDAARFNPVLLKDIDTLIEKARH